jgi:hypothetical protein
VLNKASTHVEWCAQPAAYTNWSEHATHALEATRQGSPVAHELGSQAVLPVVLAYRQQPDECCQRLVAHERAALEKRVHGGLLVRRQPLRARPGRETRGAPPHLGEQLCGGASGSET